MRIRDDPQKGEMVRNVSGVVAGMSFVIELSFLAGRSKLERLDIPVSTIVSYDS